MLGSYGLPVELAKTLCRVIASKIHHDGVHAVSADRSGAPTQST